MLHLSAAQPNSHDSCCAVYVTLYHIGITSELNIYSSLRFGLRSSLHRLDHGYFDSI